MFVSQQPTKIYRYEIGQSVVFTAFIKGYEVTDVLTQTSMHRID